MPRSRFAAWLRPLLTLAALAGVLSLAACGGGNGAPNNPFDSGNVSTPLTITPASAVTYSGNQFLFTIAGGVRPYTIISSDQAALPVAGTLDSNTLVVVPGSVGAEESVTLTVRDASGQTTQASVTVRPAFLLPTSITITGNTSCSPSGGTLCSGQNGTASVLVTGPAGAPLPGREIRFDVVQGDFAMRSTAAGQPLVSTLTAVTDQNGFAVVRLEVPTSATTQIATIRATDVASGNSISSNFTIVAFNNGETVLQVSPADVTVPGSPHDPPQCAINIPVTYFVFGGTPPYTVAANLPTFVSITGTPVQFSGGGFTVRANACVNETLTITDASGRFINATFASVLGPAATPSTGGGGGGTNCSFSPAPAGCPTVSPSQLTLTACTGTGSSATAQVTSTTTPVAAAPSGLIATITGSGSPFTLTVTRSTGTVTSPSTVTVSAGSLSQDVSVNVSPTTCP